MIVVVVLAAMCVLPLSAQVKVGVEGGMNLSHYLVDRKSTRLNSSHM